MVDQAVSQLENGVLLLSAIRWVWRRGPKIFKTSLHCTDTTHFFQRPTQRFTDCWKTINCNNICPMSSTISFIIISTISSTITSTISVSSTNNSTNSYTIISTIISSTISSNNNSTITSPREGGSCSARLACKLGDLGRGAFDSEDLLVEAVNLLVPNRYSEFSQKFEQVECVYCAYHPVWLSVFCLKLPRPSCLAVCLRSETAPSILSGCLPSV